jgi:predicted HD phosphohydrolase
VDFEVADAILTTLRAAASCDSYDEPIGLLAHSLQTGERMSKERPLDTVLQVAALLHDIGHAHPNPDVTRHAALGAKMLSRLDARLCWLVAQHTNAKRYLCTTDVNYRKLLSPRSAETLTLQGLLMTVHEVQTFEAHPWHEDAVLLRQMDDQSKDLQRKTAPLEAWRDRIAHAGAPC